MFSIKKENDDEYSNDSESRGQKNSLKETISSLTIDSSSKRISIDRLKIKEELDDSNDNASPSDVTPCEVEMPNHISSVSPMHPDDPQVLETYISMYKIQFYFSLRLHSTSQN